MMPPELVELIWGVEGALSGDVRIYCIYTLGAQAELSVEKVTGGG